MKQQAPIDRQPRSRPLRGLDFKKKDEVPFSAAPAVRKLGTRLAEAIAAVLSEFGSAKPRVTIDEIKDEVTSPAKGSGEWFRLETAAGSMTFHASLDRQSVFGLCELCFGGMGTETPFDDPERPLSAIETRLEATVVSIFCDVLTGVMSNLLGTPVNKFGGTAGIDAPEADTASAYLAFCLLLNIHGYSGTFRLLGDRSDLAAQLEAKADAPGADMRKGSGQDAFRRQISEARSIVQVAFAPEIMQVRDIISLKPGRLLRLSLNLSSPVTISSEGTNICSGVLVPSGDRLSVRLLEPAL